MAVFSKMSISSIALSLLSLSGSLINGVTANEGLEKRQGGTYAITGPQGGVQPRLEIRQLQQNADQWNLYLLAINDYRWLPQDQLLSYYQISGIHGVPNVPWDGSNGNPNNGIGYCTHVSALFPSWHRAYVTLFEQAFMNSVNTIVNQFQGSDRDRYARAASTIRLPYWDWAAPAQNGQAVLPTSITDKFITVNTPTGPQNWINPLFRFDTHPLDSAGFLDDPWDHWPVTLRYPNSTDPVAVHSQNDQATAAINSDSPNLRSRIVRLFQTCTDYQGFSNAAASARTDACQDSLEAIHNNIHNDVGGPNGHMSILWFAAFDPSFWLHHANVDRLFALWQAINPQSYTINSNNEQATYAIPAGTHVDNNFPLAPFHSDSNGNYHTSDSVRDVTRLGYTYPELASGDTSPGGVRAKFNALYGGGQTPARRRRGRARMVRRQQPLPAFPSGSGTPAAPGQASPTPRPWLAPSGAANPPSNPSAGYKPSTGKLLSNASSLLAGGQSDVEYTANVICEGFALGGSYNIYIFAGTPASENPTSWATDANLAGTHSNFAAPGMTSRTLVTGDVPLTECLLDKIGSGQLSGLSRNATVPYLSRNLQWRVMKSDGTAVPSDQVPGLTVAVRSASVKPAASDSQFPSYGKWQDHQDVTHGKAGGLQQGMASDWYTGCAPV